MKLMKNDSNIILIFGLILLLFIGIILFLIISYDDSAGISTKSSGIGFVQTKIDLNHFDKAGKA